MSDDGRMGSPGFDVEELLRPAAALEAGPAAMEHQGDIGACVVPDSTATATVRHHHQQQQQHHSLPPRIVAEVDGVRTRGCLMTKSDDLLQVELAPGKFQSLTFRKFSEVFEVNNKFKISKDVPTSSWVVIFCEVCFAARALFVLDGDEGSHQFFCFNPTGVVAGEVGGDVVTGVVSHRLHSSCFAFHVAETTCNKRRVISAIKFMDIVRDPVPVPAGGSEDEALLKVASHMVEFAVDLCADVYSSMMSDAIRTFEKEGTRSMGHSTVDVGRAALEASSAALRRRVYMRVFEGLKPKIPIPYSCEFGPMSDLCHRNAFLFLTLRTMQLSQPQPSAVDVSMHVTIYGAELLPDGSAVVFGHEQASQAATSGPGIPPYQFNLKAIVRLLKSSLES